MPRNNMGPTALFDKSFIQGLSLDESVWFDNFFIANVCPIFFAETLADLDKSTESRSPEDEVRIIADKFPERSGQPNAHHVSACIGELLGEKIPMNGQLLISGGRSVATSQGPAVVVEQTDEAKAFARWSNREFEALEYEYAQHWRASLPTLETKTSAATLATIGVNTTSCKTLESAKQLAEEIVDGSKGVLDPFQFVFSVLNPPEKYHERIISAWQSARCPSLPDYAPYTAYIVSLHFFFHIAVARNLISTRRSNTMDAAYLFYLPFCSIFVSSDKLHRQIAPLFMRDDQMFVWGLELKEDLRRLNSHYDELPIETKEKGVMCFAPQPPTEGEFLVSAIWDRMFPQWRVREQRGREPDGLDVMNLFKELKGNSNAAPVPSADAGSDRSDLRMISVQRRVRRKKGSWFQVPKALKDDDE